MIAYTCGYCRKHIEKDQAHISGSHSQNYEHIQAAKEKMNKGVLDMNNEMGIRKNPNDNNRNLGNDFNRVLGMPVGHYNPQLVMDEEEDNEEDNDDDYNNDDDDDNDDDGDDDNNDDDDDDEY